MNIRAMALGGAVAATMMIVPQIAEAAWGRVTTDLNLRACAGTQCGRIDVMPAGARVWIDGAVGSWYRVSYRGLTGFASGNYIAAGRYAPRHRRHVRPAYPAPRHGWYRDPWWDPRYRAWHDGRRWYHRGRWYDRPSGFSFGIRIGG